MQAILSSFHLVNNEPGAKEAYQAVIKFIQTTEGEIFNRIFTPDKSNDSLGSLAFFINSAVKANPNFTSDFITRVSQCFSEHSVNTSEKEKEIGYYLSNCITQTYSLFLLENKENLKKVAQEEPKQKEVVQYLENLLQRHGRTERLRNLIKDKGLKVTFGGIDENFYPPWFHEMPLPSLV